MSSHSNYFYHLLKTSPAIIHSSFLLAFIVTKDVTFLYFLIFTIILGDVMNYQEKKFFKSILPSDKKYERPLNCNIVKSQNSCSVFPGPVNNCYGFPSGHAQVTALAATLITLYMGVTKENMYSIISIWLLVLLVGLQRIYSQCHSILQVSVGWLFGILFGILSWKIIKKFK